MKKGFTLIEVSLFIAITGLLFVTIIVGTQNSIWQQKYNDSTQNFTNFLKNIYAEVSNTQGVHGGMSDKAIYGKLIVLGEEYELNGNAIPDDGTQKIFVYDVIGDASGTGTGSITEALTNLKVTVVKKITTGESITGIELAGILESYSPIWGSVIETTSSTPMLYKGAILIVRHPRSGTVNTLVRSANDSFLQINRKFVNDNASAKFDGFDTFLTDKLDEFEEKDVDFCLNPHGWNIKSSQRKDIRIIKNARNATGVMIVNDDESVCEK